MAAGQRPGRRPDAMSMRTRALGHLLPALALAAFAFAWTAPLVARLATDLPGHAGDNLDFLWNTWWMRQALAAADQQFFVTDRLFAPFGFDLTLHTHTALPSWLAATALASLPTITAHNVMLIATVALNAFLAYCLAWDRTRDRGAALLGGLIFAGSPYLAGHLTGHVNLVGAWGLPLVALLLFRSVEQRSLVASAGCGVAIGLVAYTDYYYLIYALALIAGVMMQGLWPVRVRVTPRPLPRALTLVLGTLLVMDAAIVFAIAATGGFDGELLGIAIRATRPTNPLAIGWGLLTLGLVGRFRPRLERVRRERALIVERLRLLAPLAAVALAGVLPLALRGWRLWTAGDYTAPPFSWRSGPSGLDLFTLVAGNPWHPLFGGVVRRLYDRLTIDVIEQAGWMGLVPMMLAGLAIVRHRREPEARRWLWIGGVFFVWALGPWLHIAGADLGLLLPQNLLGFLPVVSNARMPARALVMVTLAVAMLSAYVIAALPVRTKRIVTVLAALAIVADLLPAPIVTTRVEVPPLYEQVRDLPPGIVLELPVGLRDGFGMTGRFDDRVAAYQMVHGHPIVGGFAARIPESLKQRYDETPVLRTLLKLSGGHERDPRDEALTRDAIGDALHASGIKYVVLNRETATPGLVTFVELRIPLRRLATEGSRELFVLE